MPELRIFKETCQESFKRLESLEDSEELIAEGNSLLDRINDNRMCICK
jgi:hypothetical protein